VIGTVEADMHSVGKNIVAMMLRTSGFEVHDLGVDVKSASFVSRAREMKADIIALSSLMTTTRPYQREVIEELESLGLREGFKVIVGGGPVNEAWAEEIKADGYGKDAVEAVETVRKLMGIMA
jgi:methylmalonyl-CoA mutase cobalamin-binding domain/chain